jgi:Ni/Fe-hydrogenase subunit HybB-like protein
VSDDARPIGGRLFTPFFVLMLALGGIALALVAWRLFQGVGAISNLTDYYTWGIWKPINVVAVTGIGAGAYGVGLLTYIMNKGKYHPLVRQSVLVGALAYSMGGASVMNDLGRWWGSVFLFWPFWWNLNSILLEVAICVITYVAVLWVEVAPAILERWAAEGSPWAKRLAARIHAPLKKALPFIIALAMLLPTMHQSSLGSLYLMAPTKVFPLWYTGWLPFLFLVSCLIMGYGSVAAVEILAGTVLSRRYRPHMELLGGIARVAGWLSLFYVAVRLADLAVSGRILYAFTLNWRVPFFWAEMALFTAAGILFLTRRVRTDRGRLFISATIALLAGALYRIDTYLVAYSPAPGAIYFPSVGEIMVSVGLSALCVAVYLFLVKKFPILALGEKHA